MISKNQSKNGHTTLDPHGDVSVFSLNRFYLPNFKQNVDTRKKMRYNEY